MKSYLKFVALFGAVIVSALALSACQHEDNTPPPPPAPMPSPGPAPTPANQPGS